MKLVTDVQFKRCPDGSGELYFVKYYRLVGRNALGEQSRARLHIEADLAEKLEGMRDSFYSVPSNQVSIACSRNPDGSFWIREADKDTSDDNIRLSFSAYLGNLNRALTTATVLRIWPKEPYGYHFVMPYLAIIGQEEQIAFDDWEHLRRIVIRNVKGDISEDVRTLRPEEGGFFRFLQVKLGRFLQSPKYN